MSASITDWLISAPRARPVGSGSLHLPGTDRRTQGACNDRVPSCLQLRLQFRWQRPGKRRVCLVAHHPALQSEHDHAGCEVPLLYLTRDQ